MNTAEIIKKRRKELGYNADYIAKELGVSRSTIFRYENGDIEKMPIDILEPLSRILHTTPAYLMGWEDTVSAVSQKQSAESIKIQYLLQLFSQLNECGKYEAIKRIKELSEIMRYTANLKVVARNGERFTHQYTEEENQEQQDVIDQQYPELSSTPKNSL